MNTKHWTAGLFAALLLLILGAPIAMAQGAWNATFQMSPTRYGADHGASGWVKLGTRTDREFLTIQSFGKFPEGHPLLAIGLNANKEVFTIGTIEMQMGTGQLQIWQKFGPEPSPLFPLKQLRWLYLYDGKQLVLQTDFSALFGP